MSVCRVCDVELVLGENWTPGAAKACNYKCRQCTSAYYKAYYQVHRADLLIYQQKYQTENKERVAAYQGRYYENNKEHLNTQMREYHDKNKERMNAQMREYYNATRGRDKYLQREYGITLVDYDETLEAQGNGCAICGMTPEKNGQRLSVDHDHETREVRGLLCVGCNMAIGMLQDSPELCLAAARYLRCHKGQS